MSDETMTRERRPPLLSAIFRPQRHAGAPLSSGRDAAIGLAALAIAIAVPFFVTSRYYLGELAGMFIWMIVASQWNLLFGVAGVFSLAHLVIFAFGGYATAMMGFYWGWSFWLAMPAGALLTVVFALVIGVACLRLTGAYVALLTLSFGEVVRQLVITDTECFIMDGARCIQFAGGATGITGFVGFDTRALFRGDYAMADYYIILTGLVVVLLLTYVLMRGPIGLGLRALGNNPGYAVSRGVNRFKFQMVVFGISAFFTGFAGALYAGRLNSIGPQAMSLEQLLFVIGMVVVGGTGRFWGPIVGALAMTAINELMRDLGDFQVIGQGLLLAAVVVVMPSGIVGLLERLAARSPRAPVAPR